MMSPSRGGLAILVVVTLLISELVLLWTLHGVDFVLIFCFSYYGYFVALIWIKIMDKDYGFKDNG